MNVLFTTPKLKTYQDKKPWYVWFRYEKKLFIFKGGINYLHSFKEKEAAGKTLLSLLSKRLLAGWNPNEPDAVLEVEDENGNMPLNAALDFAISKINRSRSTMSSYRGTAKYIKKAARKEKMDMLPIKDLQRRHVKKLLETASQQRKWTNPSYNSNMGYFRTLLSVLVEWDCIEHNPAFKIKPLPVLETEKFPPLTDAEKIKLREFIEPNYPNYWAFLMCIYHTGIRPKELISMKIKDIDFNNNIITLTPEAGQENTKTKKIRKVPINPHLKPLLERLIGGNTNTNLYIFGIPNGTVQRHGTIKDKLYFSPGEIKATRNASSIFWKKIVMEKMGIKKHQYALKHTGANDKIFADISMEALKELYGHSSILMTERYAKKIKEVYKKQIIENSPEF